MEHMNIRVNYNMADYNDLAFPQKDREILRELGKRMAQAAAQPVMQQRKILWRDHNDLKGTRPLLLCDPENGWNEILPDSELRCQNSVARHWECSLRKQIFWGEEMQDDYVVEPVFVLPHVHTLKNWGLKEKEARFTTAYKMEEGGSYHIDAIMEDYRELEQLRKEQYLIDQQATSSLLETANEIFQGVLPVELNTVWFWSFGMTDEAAFIRGMEQLLYDFYDEPEQLHRLMATLRDGTIDKLDFLEQNNLLSLNNDNTFVGSGGLGYTSQLPAQNFSGRVGTRDMWGLAESQITTGVSPEMFAEFVFPYQKAIMERFGLTCYGCCEPLEQRFEIVKQAANLRRVSVSAWADKRAMSEMLGRDYIYSLKPTPSDLAVPQLDKQQVASDLREALSIAKDNHLEIIMKDNHTLGGNPNNLLDWVAIARKEIERL